MTDSSTAPDPNAPTRALSYDVILWGGFGLCLVIAALTVVLPELSGGDGANKKPAAPTPAAPARPAR
jgi:hypothetical protein